MSGLHELRIITHYKPPSVKKEGWVAWCTCGVGTALAASEMQAHEALLPHVQSSGRLWPARPGARQL